MSGEFLGTGGNMVAVYKGVTLLNITEQPYEERGGIGKVDVTSSGHTRMTYLIDLPEDAEVDVTVTGFMPGGASASHYTFDTDTAAGTLQLFYEGTSSGDPYIRHASATIVNRRLGAPFRQGQQYSLTFHTIDGPWIPGTL